MHLLFAICLRNFGKTSRIYQLLKPRTKVITLSATLHVHVLYRRESLFFNMFWNFALIQKSSAAPKQACIAFLQSAGTRWLLLAKLWKEFKAFRSHYLFFHMMFTSSKTMGPSTLHPFEFLLPLHRVDTSVSQSQIAKL